MALERKDFEWLAPDTDEGVRTVEGDNNQVWSLGADLEGTRWAEKNGTSFALIETKMSRHRAITMAKRLWEIWGTGALGITNKF